MKNSEIREDEKNHAKFAVSSYADCLKDQTSWYREGLRKAVFLIEERYEQRRRHTIKPS